MVEKYKVYIAKNVNGEMKLQESKTTDLSEDLLNRFGSWMVEIESCDYYFGYDKSDDISETKRECLSIETLLAGETHVGALDFNTAAAVLEDGTFAGVVIEIYGRPHLLTADKPVKTYVRESIYPHRESETHGTFILVVK